MKTTKKFVRRLAISLAAGLALPVMTALAALPQGATAPEFSLKAALAGKPMTFDLDQALKRGPVVLYFFPAAFTAGCTLEAHRFAEATPEFEKLGATVVGVTAGNIERVEEFSSVECRDKFAVAADPGAKVAAKFDATMQADGKVLSNRTSFVIAPDHKILLSYTDRSPEKHVQMAMDAVKAYQAGKK
ncbi:peroxiredoxin [Xanthomonas massiliensis]|jgi:peroxiredoxin|uniref:peroxiredoxin n=1 Tax=Xanthomonas massiliensis TaxID=1720302 RepID=UPI000826D9FD|nr:peroxiredoxin [Xanthomonas massiliensis]